jgi:hypothetical protein
VPMEIDQPPEHVGTDALAPVSGERRLRGGNVSQVWRVGDTVRKPRSGWDVGVQALLEHLEGVGFDRAPRALGMDERNRSVVSFIAGDAPGYPMPPYVWSDDTLVGVASLLRAYHDATVDFVAPQDAGWQQPMPPGAVEVVCHNDVAPYNMVFREGRPVALIDFDMAAPGPRIWDVAYAAYRFVSLGVPAGDSRPGLAREQGRRLALFSSEYDPTLAVEKLLDTVVARLVALVAFMHERAASGEPSFARHISEGDAELYERDAFYIDENRSALLGAPRVNTQADLSADESHPGPSQASAGWRIL